MTSAEWTPLAGLGMVLIFLTPLVIALFFAMRGERTTPRRWFFVLLASTSSYGFFSVIFIVIWTPIEFVLYWLAPESLVNSSSATELVDPAVNYAYTSVYVVALLLMVAFSIALTRFLWRKWPRIAEVSTHER
jgi:hypothetical protein